MLTWSGWRARWRASSREFAGRTVSGRSRRWGELVAWAPFSLGVAMAALVCCPFVGGQLLLLDFVSGPHEPLLPAAAFGFDGGLTGVPSHLASASWTVYLGRLVRLSRGRYSFRSPRPGGADAACRWAGSPCLEGRCRSSGRRGPSSPRPAEDEVTSAATALGRNGEGIPLVSPVLITFNRVNVLEDTLRSVLTKTLSEFELIVFDDASTDGIPVVMPEWAARDPRILYVRQPRNLKTAGICATGSPW